MDAVLSGSVAAVTKDLQRPQSLDDRNTFGQSAVHFAVLRPNVLRLLLGVCSDLDVQDHAGRSPLVYAAAYGCTESTILLLQTGADPKSVDESGARHLTFLAYAMSWRQWDVATRALDFFRASRSFSSDFLTSELDYLIDLYFQYSWRHGPEDMKILFDLGANPHFIFDKGDTLLHRIESDAEAEALFQAGYNSIDRPNNEGQTALCSLIYRNAACYKKVIARGANTKLQNIGINHRP